MENTEIKTNEKQYRNKITLMSFILAILVLIRHACNYTVYNISNSLFFYVQRFFTMLTDIAVPTFFMLSGYLFFCNFNYSNLLNKYKKRVVSILIPYLIWSFLSYLYFLLLSSIPQIGKNLNSDNYVVFSFTDMISSVLFGKYNAFWFLQNLMVYIILAPIFFLILKNKHIGYTPAIVTLIIGFFLNKFNVQNNVNSGFLKFILNGQLYSYFTLYLLGAYFGACFKDKLIGLKFKKTYCYIATFLIIIISVLRVITNDFATEIFTLYYIIMAAQSILIWISLDFLRVSKCCWIFENSFFIYCTHSLILEGIEKLFFIIFKNTFHGAVIDFIFAPIITITIILLLSYFLSKYTPKIWKVICGGRGYSKKEK